MCYMKSFFEDALWKVSKSLEKTVCSETRLFTSLIQIWWKSWAEWPKWCRFKIFKGFDPRLKAFSLHLGSLTCKLAIISTPTQCYEPINGKLAATGIVKYRTTKTYVAIFVNRFECLFIGLSACLCLCAREKSIKVMRDYFLNCHTSWAAKKTKQLRWLSEALGNLP